MIGIVIALGAVVVTFLLKGVSPTILLNLPSFFIVVVGTAGATIAGVGLPAAIAAFKLVAIAARGYRSRAVELRTELVGYAERARREGLLALEADADRVPDPFVRRGLQMVIDGLEPDTVEELLDLEIEAMRRRHAAGVTIWSQMAGYAPTFGILGAVMGLIAVMAHLSEPDKLGTGIQVAFIATLLAVGLANAVLMPISVALRNADAAEHQDRLLAQAGILAIQAGDNPRIVARKLETYLTPAQVARAEQRPAETPAPQPAAAMETA